MTDDGADGPTDQDLRDLLDAELHRGLVEERRHRHRRRQQAEESVSFAEALGALAARQTMVSVRTTTATLPSGTISEVGRDYLALRAAGCPVRLVPIERITSATPVALRGEVPGPSMRFSSRSDPLVLSLAERLRELARLGSRLQVTADGVTYTGRAHRIGLDVIVLDDPGGPEVYLALAAVDDVAVDP